MFFTNKKKNKEHYYLAIHLKEQEGLLLVIDSYNKDVPILDQKKFVYTNGWEHIIEDIDEVLYQLELKHKIQLKKTIFFLYSHLIDIKTGNIKQPYQKKVKKIVEELELTPLGFIDYRDGVINYLENKDKIKLTAILIEIDKNNISPFVYKNNQLIFGQNVARTDNFIDDISDLFKQAKEKTFLPPRIILYNSSDLEKSMNEIISYHWPKDFFIQLPKVEIIKEDEIINNLVNLFISQLDSDKKQENLNFKTETVEDFLIGQDIKEKAIEKKEKNIILKNNNSFNFFSILKNLSFKLPKLSFSVNFFKFNTNFYLLLGFLLILTAFFINEYFFHRLTLELFLPTKKIEKIYFLSYSLENPEILTRKITTEKRISVEKKTTNKKNIGSPAKGEVIVFNFNKEITFPKGTVINYNGLKFIFDTEVKVASASLTSDNSAKLPGKAKVKVTAEKIGEDGNLTKGKKFTIEDYDSETYFAKNEVDFSGGTEKTVMVVSAKDLEDLEKKAVNDVKRQKVEFKLLPNEKIINLSITYQLTDKEFSKEVDEEANSVSLEGTVLISGLSYNHQKMLENLKKKISPILPTNFILSSDNINYSIIKINNEEEKIEIKTIAKATKKIDKNEIINKIRLRNIYNLDDILKNQFKIVGYKENHHQPLIIPFYKNFLPIFKKNYQIIFSDL